MLPTPELQRALGGVRFVRYDVDSFAGGAAYERLTRQSRHRVPTFVGLVDEKPVRIAYGLTPNVNALARWIDELAALGGSETRLHEALADRGDDAQLLLRAGRWYFARQRRAEGIRYLDQVAARSDAPEEVRAEAEWLRGPSLRKGMPRDPRAPLAFVIAHPSSAHVHEALQVAAVLKDAPPEDVAAAYRACFDAWRDRSEDLNDLAYHALAAHQYDAALQIAQQAVRLQRDSHRLDTLAEVHYYRHEPAMAVAMAERALALEPSNEVVQANLRRFRRADGTPCDTVENMRMEGFFQLPRFYGDEN
jgi:tetratricopeptide (TPR) repeat protein